MTSEFGTWRADCDGLWAACKGNGIVACFSWIIDNTGFDAWILICGP